MPGWAEWADRMRRIEGVGVRCRYHLHQQPSPNADERDRRSLAHERNVFIQSSRRVMAR